MQQSTNSTNQQLQLSMSKQKTHKQAASKQANTKQASKQKQESQQARDCPQALYKPQAYLSQAQSQE